MLMTGWMLPCDRSDVCVLRVFNWGWFMMMSSALSTKLERAALVVVDIPAGYACALSGP